MYFQNYTMNPVALTIWRTARPQCKHKAHIFQRHDHLIQLPRCTLALSFTTALATYTNTLAEKGRWGLLDTLRSFLSYSGFPSQGKSTGKMN